MRQRITLVGTRNFLATQPSFFGQVTLLRPDQPEETG